jgi:DmsE family decaheme c-type cytochrome
MNRSSRSLLAALVACGACAPMLSSSQGSAPDESTPYSAAGADTCLMCHSASPEVLAIFRTKHAVATDARGPFGHGQLQCESCHGPGGAHATIQQVDGKMAQVIRFAPDSTASVETQNATCLGCHDADTGFATHGGAHEDNQVSCASCHELHRASDPVLGTSTQAAKCYECHAFQKGDSLKAYSHPLREGKMSCTGCHNPHGATTEMLLARQTINDTCYQCHADKRGPFLWEHAPVAEDCTTCHSPHGSNQPGMLVQRAPLLCQSCHSQSGHPSVAQDAGGLATGQPSQFLLGRSCLNCHSQIHGSNHPSGSKLMR